MTTFDTHVNGGYSTVATAPSPAASGTTLVVATGEGARFGSSFPMPAIIWPNGQLPHAGNSWEIVTITGRSTDTLTITRAQQSTSARTVVVGDQIAAGITAKALTDIETAVNAASVNPHGAADHTNITRSFFLKVGEGVIDGAAGAASTIGTQPFQLRVAGQRDAAALDGYLWTFQIPLDWASGALIAQPVWIPGSTDASAHAIRWSPVAGELAAGTDYTSAGGTYAFTGSAAARTANQIVYDTATAIFTPSAAGNLALMDYRRNGSDAADTYVGTSYLVGVIITYTATQ